ncbi:Alcohol dehydrogenase 2 [Nymphaea thermarum]|nr:Alcohol dehydrogenase 2 [Nymphaea thermarum]
MMRRNRGSSPVMEEHSGIFCRDSLGSPKNGLRPENSDETSNSEFELVLGPIQILIVESVGQGVTELKTGDHVLPIFTGECGECAHCKSEESNMCDLLMINTDRGMMLADGKSRFSIKGELIYHFVGKRTCNTKEIKKMGTSTFSEYTVVHVGCLAKVNPGAPLDKICVLSCVISTGFRATVNVAKPKRGQSVAVFGLGAEGARVSGASRIIGIDLNPNRCTSLTLSYFSLISAKKFGCTEFFNPQDYDRPIQQVIAELTNGGVDRSVECTGHIDAMISAFESVHDVSEFTDDYCLIYIDHPHLLDTHPMNFLNEKTLKGTFYGNYKPRSDIPGVVELSMKKELELDKFCTHRLSFKDINKAFDLMLSGQGIRCIKPLHHTSRVGEDLAHIRSTNHAQSLKFQSVETLRILQPM